MANDKKNPLDSADVIYAYTRQQALEDGVLINVSNMAKEAIRIVSVGSGMCSIWHDRPSAAPNQARLNLCIGSSCT